MFLDSEGGSVSIFRLHREEEAGLRGLGLAEGLLCMQEALDPVSSKKACR